MISNLTIANYALIENLEIDFNSGFITITGETGAGKSILMGALSLILGQRADSSVLLNKERKCIVEGEFRIDKKYHSFFKENDIDFEEYTILRREILPGGKSRAFINDTPVSLSVLKSLGDNLVDIHSQHQNLRLKDHLYQLEVVDYVGETNSELEEYGRVYDHYRKKEKEIQHLILETERIKGDLDYFNYQFEELSKAGLDSVDLSYLEAEVNQMEHSEEIKRALLLSSDAIGGEGQVLERINEILNHLRKIEQIYPSSKTWQDRIDSAYIDLKDINAEIQQAEQRSDYNQEAIEAAKAKIDLLYSLLQKHRAGEISELIKLREEFRKKIEAITFSDERLEKLQKEKQDLEKELTRISEVLHKKRGGAAKRIDIEVVSTMKQLGIPNASFLTVVEKKALPDRNGADDVKFLFSANKQVKPEEISKIASGGEISRVMLAIKSLLSDYHGLPTLIFDEIDAGVSGEVAEKMGIIMKKMSEGRQVVAITHLPQVASLGNEHLLVYKTDDTEATVTHIKRLNSEERIVEIAKLLSGEELTQAAISNARELLKN